ncbi:Uncharacterised protein [Burkholderia pseudomallei]|nr:Uncharacterised protein [Burkholderia pseudomallei]
MRAARGRRDAGARGLGGALAARLDDLVERQIQHAVARLVADVHLRRVRIDLLHRLEIHPLADHRGRLRVLRVDLLEAFRVALGLRDDALGVRLRVVDHLRRVALRARQQFACIRLRGVLRGLAVLTRFRDVVDGGLHLLGRRNALHGHARHDEARAVAVEVALDRFRKRVAQCVAILREHLVRAPRTDDLAHRRLRGLRYAALGIDGVKQIVGGRPDPILNGEAHVDDIGVAREHRRVLHVREPHHVVAADLDRAHLRGVDDLVRFERIRQTPMDAVADRALVLAQAQHDARLAVLDDEDAAAEIDRDQHARDDADADARGAPVVGTKAVVAAALAAEPAAQATVEVPPHFVEIRGAVVAPVRALRLVRARLVAVAAASPAGIVDRQQGAHSPPGTPLVVVVHLCLFTRLAQLDRPQPSAPVFGNRVVFVW